MAMSKNRGQAARLYVRVREEDRLLLHERAAARGMASATYLSVLLRAHLRSLAPLPKDELAALKRVVGELGAVGRNLNQIARAANQGARVAGPERDEFRTTLKICGPDQSQHSELGERVCRRRFLTCAPAARFSTSCLMDAAVQRAAFASPPARSPPSTEPCGAYRYGELHIMWITIQPV